MNVTIQTTEATAFENSLFLNVVEFVLNRTMSALSILTSEAIIEFPADPGYCKADSPPGSGFRG